MGQERNSYPVAAGFLYPAAFLSGATALLYEIVWARRLSLLLGNGTAAATAVLSSFMLGLALGAVLVGGRTDTSRRPLRWYGILELGIGFYALAFDTILDVSSGISAAQPWLFSFAVLLLPAMLMGATLPVLARAGADSREGGTRVFGNLYGINTLGAVIGALATTFLLMRVFGLTLSAQIAAFLNIALGIAFRAADATIARRKDRGQDIDGSSMTNHQALPVPAVYAIDRSGRISYAFVEADYKVRLPADELLAEAKKLTN